MKHRGLITLTLTMVLVLIMASVLVFIGKVLLIERRITLNELEYRLAFATAEQGIAEAITRFKVDPQLREMTGSQSHPLGEVSYQVSLTEHTHVAGVAELVSVASMASGARSEVSVQVTERSILNPLSTGPAAPLMVGTDNIQLTGRLTVVAHPNGGGSGVALSLWSRGTLAGSGELYSCPPADYDPLTAQCTSPTSYPQGGVQVLGEDVLLANTGAPEDVLEYVFGYGLAEWSNLVALAHGIVTDCAEITGPGFFIMTGSHCQLEQIVSSAQAPVILLSKDTAINASTATEFYGLLFAYGSSDRQTLALATGSKIVGGLFSNKLAIDGDFSVIYDPEVWCVLTACQPQLERSPFIRIHTLPGSWHD